MTRRLFTFLFLITAFKPAHGYVGQHSDKLLLAGAGLSAAVSGVMWGKLDKKIGILKTARAQALVDDDFQKCAEIDGELFLYASLLRNGIRVLTALMLCTGGYALQGLISGTFLDNGLDHDAAIAYLCGVIPLCGLGVYAWRKLDRKVAQLKRAYKAIKEIYEAGGTNVKERLDELEDDLFFHNKILRNSARVGTLTSLVVIGMLRRQLNTD